MKIAMILTNGFDPDPRVYKEALSLTKLGHKVEIICWDRECKHSSTPVENLNNIKIVRFFGTAKYGSGYKQGIKFLQFKRFVYDYIKSNNFDAIHCHDFDGIYIGYSINNKLKLKLVYDEHDLFYMYFINRNGLLNKLIYKYIISKEAKMLKKVDTHIVVTPEMKKVYGNKSKRLVVINNAPSHNIFTDITKTECDVIRVGYIGSIRYVNELKTLVDVSQRFKDKINVIISGGGVDLQELKEYCSQYNNVEITGGFTMDQLEVLYKNIDITYAFYPSDVSAISMPNKFYESIITETPIIANKETEFGREVVHNLFGFGVSEENTVEELEKVICKLLSSTELYNNIKDNMKRNKYKYLWEANEEHLSEIYS